MHVTKYTGADWISERAHQRIGRGLGAEQRVEKFTAAGGLVICAGPVRELREILPTVIQDLGPDTELLVLLCDLDLIPDFQSFGRHGAYGTGLFADAPSPYAIINHVGADDDDWHRVLNDLARRLQCTGIRFAVVVDDERRPSERIA